MSRKPTNWQLMIEQQLSSGLNAAEFCRQNNLNQKYFSHYKCKLQKASSNFIKVKPENCIKPTAPKTYTLTCNGVSFECSNNTDTKFIAQLLRELQA